MLIKMICGTYGAMENGLIIAKDSNSAPFEVLEEKGKRLVALGYAQEVGCDTETEVLKDAAPEAAKELEEADLSDYSIQDIRRMAKEMGLSAGGNKQQIIDRMIEARNNADEVQPTKEDEPDEAVEGSEDDAHDNSDEAPPALEAAEPEV